MSGLAVLVDILAKKSSISRQNLHSWGLFSAAVAASSAAVSLARGRTIIPKPFFRDLGVSIAFADAGATFIDEEAFKGAKEIHQEDYYPYFVKEYKIELKPLLSAFMPRSLALTTLRSFLMFFLPLLETKLVPEDNEDDLFGDHIENEHVDLITPLLKSMRQIVLEITVVTLRRVLERLSYYYFSQRTAWKLLKDSSMSAKRKAGKGLPMPLYFWGVARTTFRGYLLGVAASWFVNVGIDVYHVLTVFPQSDGAVISRVEQVKVLRKNLVAVTIRCCSSLIFASVGAGIGSLLLRPSIGQQLGGALGDFVGPTIVLIFIEKFQQCAL